MSLQDQSFASFDEWNDKRAIWMRGVRADEIVYFDSLGRRCASALHFVRARDDGAFPVRWLMLDQVGSVALYSIGCRALKYHVEKVLNWIDPMGLPPEMADAVSELRGVLDLMNRVGSPAGADALHRQMLMAKLTDASFEVLASFNQFFEDVETWKTRDGVMWKDMMTKKIAKLREHRAALA